MQIFTNKANAFVVDFIKTNYERINVNSGKCMYNYMCHANSVHIAVKNKHEKIALCYILDEGVPIIHFINVNNKGYVDNTLGYFTKFNDYYFVRFINKNEFDDVFTIHKKLRKQIKNQLPFFIRILANFEA